MYLKISSKWRVLSVAVFVQLLDYGFSFSLGTIFQTMLEKFGESRSKTAALQSLFVGVCYMSTTLTGLFISRWGVCRGKTCAGILMPLGFFASFFANNMVFLYISIGIIGGLGNSFALMSCVVAVGQSFSEYQRSLAMSVLQTAIGSTTLVFPYFLTWLVDLFGLNGAFLVLSAIYLHTFIALIVFRYEIQTHIEPVRKLENDSKRINLTNQPADLATQKINSTDRINQNDIENNSKEKGTLNRYVKETSVGDKPVKLTSVIFLTFFLSSALMLGNASGFLSVAQDIFIDKGLSEPEALSGYLVFNLVSVVFRLVPAIASKCGLNTFILSLIISAGAAGGQIIIYLFSSHVAILIGCSLTGAAYGGFASFIPIKTFELLNVDKQAIGYGLIVTTVGALSIGFGPLFGAIRDTTGQYAYVLIILSSLHGLSFLLILTCMAIQRLKRK